ncbi:hypothetical protein D3C75_940870 [compost metagenome]
MGHGCTVGDQRGVSGQVSHKDRVQQAGHDVVAVNTGKPQQVGNQHRQKDGWQRIANGNQRLEHLHNRCGQQQLEFVLHQEADGVDRQQNAHHRVQQFKRTGNGRRNLFRHANGDVVLFQQADQFDRPNGADQGSEYPLAT